MSKLNKPKVVVMSLTTIGEYVTRFATITGIEESISRSLLIDLIIHKLTEYELFDKDELLTEPVASAYMSVKLYKPDQLNTFKFLLADINTFIDPWISILTNASYAIKEYAQPTVHVGILQNSLRITIQGILPPTDYVGAMTTLIDQARERGEFIPYRCLEFIRKC